ncbi:hypothetical protein BGZ99_000907 [Dissophora globulifera]|uniref:BZIP domain-containing protein n=1 Tax=Dissophora globulifera TaxID=979702 RepID=A0A9P6R144_9FUNG|nr:hypothetical protein BGZ99_000907 [Dissophora globulifera]
MTSTAPHQPQLAQKQAELDRPDKRPYPGTPPSENAHEQYSDDDDANNDDDQDGYSVRSLDPSTYGATEDGRDPNGEPPMKTRKKPGRKPNPASPAVRKEQNRAAQRAFRDRKERHLQQLENMIKDLKESHHHSSLRFQRESQQLKGIIESLQSENYYLREVVFSFESALGKTGNAALLQDVKAELYRRHYETHAARKLSFSVPQQHPSPSISSMSASSPAPVAASTPAPAPVPTPMTVPSMPGPVPVDDRIPHATQVQMLNQALTAAMAAHAASVSASASAIVNANANANVGAHGNAKQAFASSQIPLNHNNNMASSSSLSASSASTNAWTQLGFADPQDDNLFSMNSASLFSSSSSDDGKTASSTASTDPLSSARSNLTASAPWINKQTYDELQATLFSSQASLHSSSSSANSTSSKISSPQNMAADASLFGQLNDHSFSPNQNMFTFTAGSMDAAFPNQTPSFLDSDDVDSNEFSMATPNLAFDDSLKGDVIPTYRLQMELRVLASAPPATDPSIDPKIYAMPHDSRIDLIPCPKLRAKMILHQHEYDIEELCQLLIGGAICHGHPLDPHNWELPPAFFDRYGYLMGQELMKYKNKVWPKKNDSQRHNAFRNF